MALTYYDIATLPQPLDIVWCRFPTSEMPKQPGPKPRPALVRSILLSKDHTRGAVEITYGTSKYSPQAKPNDLHVCNMAEMAKCGLPQATCFMLERTIRLPWATEFFTTRDDGTGPIIGHLPDSACMQLETLKVLRRQLKLD